VSAVALWSQLTGRERRRRWGLILSAVAAVAVLGVALMRQRTALSSSETAVPTAALEPVSQPVVAAVAPPPAPSIPPAPSPADAKVPPVPSTTAEAPVAVAPSASTRPLAQRRPPAPARPHSTPPPVAKQESGVTDFGGRR
jgi:hypothetical protein